jgi:hypothetical protein
MYVKRRNSFFLDCDVTQNEYQKLTSAISQKETFYPLDLPHLKSETLASLNGEDFSFSSDRVGEIIA